MSQKLDCEIVVLGSKGAQSFNALQKSFDHHTSGDGIVYFLFDVPFLEGFDLRQVELASRRRLLKALLDERKTEHIRFSADLEADPAKILQSVRQMNMEGVIAKRGDAPYASTRAGVRQPGAPRRLARLARALTRTGRDDSSYRRHNPRQTRVRPRTLVWVTQQGPLPRKVEVVTWLGI